MTKTQFINRVLLLMNEAGKKSQQAFELVGADATQVEAHIEQSYPDAWKRCVNVFPLMWFENKSFATATPTINIPDGTGYVVLPDDYYTLSKFKMNGWAKAVQQAPIEDDRITRIQSNEHTRGTMLRPACTVGLKVVETVIKRVINYYSLPKDIENHIISEALYVPIVKSLDTMLPTDELSLDSQIIEPMAYLSASTVLVMFEKYDVAKALESRALEMVPGLQSVIGKNATTKQ